MAVETVTEVKRGIIALFEDRLRAKLDQYDAKQNDGVTTPSPAVYYDVEKKIVEAYPAVEVFPTAAAPLSDSLAHVYRNRLVVGYRLAGDDDSKLQRQCEAMMWAIRHVARDTHLDGDEDTDLGPIDSGNEEFAMLPIPPGFEIPFIKGGYIELFLTTVEEA
jgi:hypothetical protein